MFKYFVFNDPTWDYTRYDLSTCKKDTAQAAAILNATNPNLDAFKAQGAQAAAVARLVRSGADRARQHQVLRAGAGARSEGARLLQDVPDAGRAALRRRARSRHRRLGGGDRRLGGERARRPTASSRRRSRLAAPSRARVRSVRIRSARSTAAPAAPTTPRTSSAVSRERDV